MKPGYKKRGCPSPNGCYCTGACEEEVIDINALIVNQEVEEELGYILPGELKPHERKDNSNEKI